MVLAGRMRRRRLLALAVALAAAMACSALPASAHTTHEGSETLFKGVSGPNEFLVTVVPLVGFLEVTVVVDPLPGDSQSGYAYASPRVVVTASRGEAQLGPEAAQQGRAPANEYVAVLRPDAPGRWDIVINIDSERGPSSLTLPVQVRERPGFPWMVLVAGLGIVLPILWLVFAPRRKSTRPTSRGT